MRHEPNPIHEAAAPAALQPLRALLRRLGGCLDGSADAFDDRLAAEIGFHALDDVACIRIRRR